MGIATQSHYITVKNNIIVIITCVTGTKRYKKHLIYSIAEHVSEYVLQII